MSLRYLFSPSGGIAYHLIARRRSRTVWRSFRANVRAWLEPWLASAVLRASGAGLPKELIVFGPSAGWTLPLSDFSSFDSIVFVEPDPLARSLLRRHLRASGIRLDRVSFYSRADLLPWSSRAPGEFARFLGAHPGSAVLFANVLGQVSLHRPPLSGASAASAVSVASAASTERDEMRAEFFDALKDHAWASYHDLYSGSRVDARPLPQSSVSSSILLNEPDLIAGRVFTQGDVIDHETNWLSRDRATELAVWPLTESSLHIIGFVSNDGA